MVIDPLGAHHVEFPAMLTLRNVPSPSSVDHDDHLATARGQDHFTARGAQALARVRRAVREGNVLRILIKDEDGRTLIEIPELLGVRGGARMTPVWAALDALASVSGKLTVEVKRESGWPQYGE
jgi:hypothetical protein